MNNKILSFRFPFILVILFFLIGPFKAEAQHPNEISFALYPGFTAVNFEKALGYPDDYMDNWSQFHYGVAARGFLSSEKSLQAGAEIAWQRLYYGYYVVPYGYSPVYREFNVSTVSLMALGKYYSGQFFAVGGAGFHFFNDGTALAFTFEGGYAVELNDRMAVPLSLRISPVLGDGTPVVLALGAGISMAL